MLKTAYAAVSVTNLMNPTVHKVSWNRELVEKDGGQVVEFKVEVDELEFLKIVRGKLEKLVSNAIKADAFIGHGSLGRTIIDLSNVIAQTEKCLNQLEDERAGEDDDLR